MDHAVLVDIDVRIGSQIIEALDAAGLGPDVALWATFTDYPDPRLVFAFKGLDDDDKRPQHGRIQAILHGKFSIYSLPTLLILRINDPFIKDLRESFSSLSGIEGMRLDSQSFAGRYLLDGYVYRIQ